MRRHKTASLAAALIMVACATAPVDSRLYSLAEERTAPAENETRAPDTELAVDQIRVADFLRRSGIVYKTAPNQVSVARQNRWADPLPTQLRRYVYSGLSARLGGASVYPNALDAPAQALRLAVDFNAFHGRFDGMALVSGTWRLRGSDGSVVASSSFKQMAPLAEDGYGALVAALSKGLDKVVSAIAEAVGEQS